MPLDNRCGTPFDIRYWTPLDSSFGTPLDNRYGATACPALHSLRHGRFSHDGLPKTALRD